MDFVGVEHGCSQGTTIPIATAANDIFRNVSTNIYSL